MSKVKTVDQYVANLEPARAEIVERLRNLIKKAFPEVSEEISPWGGPVFMVSGNPVVWMGNYSRHTNFGFFTGSQLESKLLEGTGKNFRHVKVRTVEDIDEPELIRLLKAAAKLKPQ